MSLAPWAHPSRFSTEGSRRDHTQAPHHTRDGCFLEPPEPRGGWRLGSVDGSGGTFSSDPRLRRVGWGAGVWDEQLNPLGTLQGNVVGLQTINRAELKGAIELLRHTKGDLIVVTDSAYLIRGHTKGPRRRLQSNRRLWLEYWRVFGAREGHIRYLKVKSHATDPEVRARFPDWALFVNDKADELASEAAAQAAVPQDLVSRVLAMDTLAEQIRRRLAAIQMMWWTHFPAEELPAETKRAQRRERSDKAFQHLLTATSHWPQVNGDQVSCIRCGKQTHRRTCARWLRCPCRPRPIAAEQATQGPSQPDHSDGGPTVHPSHRSHLAWCRGVLWCRRCGCWRVRASKKFKALCTPPSNSQSGGHKAILKLSKGQLPPGLKEWPGGD